MSCVDPSGCRSDRAVTLSASLNPPHPILRFMPPLAIVLVAAMVPPTVRFVRSQIVGESPNNAFEVGRLPKVAVHAAQMVAPPLDRVQRVEDLPQSTLALGRKLTEAELTSKLIRKAEEVLRSQYPALGSEIPLEVDGRIYFGRVEMHFHEEGGPKKPWGYHRGMTLYAAE